MSIPLEKIRRVLIIGSIGIGNLLLFSPCLTALRKRWPDAHIAVVVLKEVFRALYEADPRVDAVHVLDASPAARWRDRLVVCRRLRRQGWDLSITTFPASRLEYNLLSFLLGARYRLAHHYPRKYWRSLSFLQNRQVPVDRSLHDLDQNRALLRPLGLEDTAERALALPLGDRDRAFADAYLRERGIGPDEALIGMHPGSSVERNMIFKRWDAARFGEVGARVAGDLGGRVLVFGGPGEGALADAVAAAVGGPALAVTGTALRETAALVARCGVFLSNDSGLMHVAVAMGVPVVALFGPSDPGRTAPFGAPHTVIRAGLECSPCWSIKNLGVGRIPCIYAENRCMQALDVDPVVEAVRAAFRPAAHPAPRPAPGSDDSVARTP